MPVTFCWWCFRMLRAREPLGRVITQELQPRTGLLCPASPAGTLPRGFFMRAKNELKNHPQVKDLTGQVFGRLMVKEFAGVRNGAALWICMCECGKETVTRAANLKNGETSSCGCLKEEMVKELGRASKRHGESNTYLNRVWSHLRQRCHNPSDPYYHRYGGRGITVHPSFSIYENFRDYILANLKARKPGQSLDRINNDGNYEPGNLRWATPPQQSRNTGRNRLVNVFGETLCLVDAIDKWGVANYTTVHARLNEYGWPLEKALLTPPRKMKNNARPTPTPTPTRR